MSTSPDPGNISRCEEKDLHTIYEIINDAARAYQGVIPDDLYHEPYMTKNELKSQIDQGIQFWGFAEKEETIGVMGIQFKGEVTLIRHAYVRTGNRNKGIGSRLLENLCAKSTTPILIGTWADAKWAIQFYINHGFSLLPVNEKDNLLRKYWIIPVRQQEGSVVLASSDWIRK